MTKIRRLYNAIRHPHAAPWEIRMVRVIVALALVAAAISTLNHVIVRDKPILDANKLEVGMLIGWIVAKSGTVVDWLFGGSESGTRRADQSAAREVESPSGQPDDPVNVTDPDWPTFKDALK